MRARCIVAVAALALAAPAVAPAATVGLEGGVLVFRGEPGEANRVVVTRATAGALWVLDAGATIAPAFPCVSVTASLAECPGQSVERLHLLGGDGDDELTSSTDLDAVLRGGPGDDVLTGGLAFNELHGNAGDDVLVGGPGDDLLDGGPGSDDMRGDPPGTPFLEGGVDLVSYRHRTRGVRVSLDGRANDGEPGERDRVHDDVEIVLGGRGDDLLVGNAGIANALVGGPGDDVVAGGGGAIDLVLGGPGNDVIRGGSSHGLLFGGGGNDRISGGRGSDLLVGSKGRDVLLGGPGHDALFGGTGRDTLVGGPGRDRFSAVDGLRDRVFGGPGRDTAFVDEGLDVVVGVERFPARGLASAPAEPRLPDDPAAALRVLRAWLDAFVPR